jgi:hypothetical protein
MMSLSLVRQTKIFSILLLIISFPLKSLGQVISSPLVQVNMLEVYTSQGCSSCPPAERWMSQFKQDKRLWKQLVPMNFHVDYWDYLGWKDPYASSTFTQRQRDYKALRLSPTVATPGFVVAGQGWNGWFRGKPVPTPPFKAVGVLRAQLITNTKMESAHVTFNPVIKIQQPLVLHVAILGFDQITHVKRGENSGRPLPHDFVVMAYEATSLELQKGQYSADINLPSSDDFTSAKKALVFWVSQENNPSPIQVAANWWK